MRCVYFFINYDPSQRICNFCKTSSSWVFIGQEWQLTCFCFVTSSQFTPRPPTFTVPCGIYRRPFQSVISGTSVVCVSVVKYALHCFLVSAIVLDRPMSVLFCLVDFHPGVAFMVICLELVCFMWTVFSFQCTLSTYFDTWDLMALFTFV